jgi:hypothetical protein
MTSPIPDEEREVPVERDDRDPAAATPPDDPESPAYGIVDDEPAEPAEPNEPA